MILTVTPAGGLAGSVLGRVALVWCKMERETR
jgi:hypothetical protein